MIISIPKETTPGERRVALVPDIISKLIKLGFSVQIEAGAGVGSGYADESYQAAGATIVADPVALYASADLLFKVQKPGLHPSGKSEIEMMKSGSTYVGFFYGLYNPELAKEAAARKINVLAMDAIPRITRAQSMDALSSQSNLAGYKAVLLAANHLLKIFPLLTTAAGTIRPAKVVIIGAGVAGLQAIATAKRLGAVVEVSDVRPAVKEQVQSLGGTYIEVPSDENLADASGYAKQASEAFLKKQQEVLGNHCAKADCIITTALVPGKPAPKLIPASVVERMQAGSVIVDLASEQGGNCELTVPGEVVVKHGVTIVGHTNLPTLVPFNASEMYAKNIFNVLKEFVAKDGSLNWDFSNEVIEKSLVTFAGEIRHPGVREKLGLSPLNK